MPTISQGHNIKYLIKTLNILQSLKFVTALLSLLLKKTCSIDDFYNYNILFIDHPLTLMGIIFFITMQYDLMNICTVIYYSKNNITIKF